MSPERLKRQKKLIERLQQRLNEPSYVAKWALELIEKMPFPTAVVDANGFPVIANKQLINWLGYPNEELKKMDFARSTVTEYISEDEKQFNDLIEGRNPNNQYSIRKEWYHKNGDVKGGLLAVSVHHNGAAWTIAQIAPDDWA